MNAKLTPEDILKPKHAATYRNSVVRADKFEQMMNARIARKHPNWDDSDIWTEIFEMRSDVEFAARKEEGRA